MFGLVCNLLFRSLWARGGKQCHLVHLATVAVSCWCHAHVRAPLCEFAAVTGRQLSQFHVVRLCVHGQLRSRHKYVWDVMAVWWLTANGICPPCRCQLRLHGHCQRRCQQWCHLCNCHRCADRRFHRRQQLHHHGATAKNAGELFGQSATRMEYMSVFFYIQPLLNKKRDIIGQLDAWLWVWAPNEGPNTSRWLSLSHVPLEDAASKYTWKLGFWMRFCVRNEGKSINKTAILVMRQANVCLELGAAMFQNGALSSPGVVWTRYG